MEAPFAEVHEFYRIAYLRMQARMEAQKEEEEKHKKEEEQRRMQERQNDLRNNARGPRKPWNPTDAKHINNQSKPSTPPSIDVDDLEELLEDGGLI